MYLETTPIKYINKASECLANVETSKPEEG